MATVYLATDLRLERRVAIKVMHGHLADDSEYKARFIQEARSAARLAHPNVVNVYDQGQDDDTAYLVMEYLPGITLRDLLQEHRILTTTQSMDIMEAILSGLAAAHKNGIVHRDLKPENVLLADDGRIKIGDFGLARAATANTATGNALLGTIAYLSPELVMRGVADTRSDIYAVGIMLYEMLAGEQPFKGEQAFQIAQQHANDTVPTPSSKNPRVPAELDELVLWATARDPDQRPRDARMMLDQLLDTQASLQSDDPSTAATAVQRTMVFPSVGSSVGAASDAETQIIAPRSRQRTGPVLTDSVNALATKTARRRSRGFWLFGLVLVLAALAGGTGWYFGAGPGSLVTIRDVSAMTEADARTALKAQDLTVAATTTTAYSTSVAQGKVVGTTPKTGTQVEHRGQVTLVISNGPQPLPVPKLVGLSEDQAKQAIGTGHFAYKASSTQFDPKVAQGVVLAAVGADGSPLAEGQSYGEQQPISLVVSLGPIPSVAGQSISEAQSTLQAKGITGIAGASEPSATIAKGLVIRAQAQDNKPVNTGGTVDLILSSGKPQVSVPDVVGLTWDKAKPILVAAGFTLSYDNKVDAFSTLSVVTKVSPGSGTTVDQGSTLKINFKASFSY
ncbi:MAG: eukaryotic-like serine/threonine-protein kinase [Microbacteriaceae bacterium]|nr:pknB [Microbacteriaceae bacterium]MDQ1548911.1 eukaryotic-like serine/threonine-protein kinase [Microbacteriaceae bacterium]